MLKQFDRTLCWQVGISTYDILIVITFPNNARNVIYGVVLQNVSVFACWLFSVARVE